MKNSDPQPIQLELFPDAQGPQTKTTSKRLPNKGKQSIHKPLVRCQITIERIGVIKHSRTPYIVYTTQYGRCCTFVSRKYFTDSLFHLMGIKYDRVGTIKSVGLSQFSITVRQGKNFHRVSNLEVREYLARQNQVALDRLQVKLVGSKIIVWNPNSGTTSEVTHQGCTCSDTAHHDSFCKHRLAAHFYLTQRRLGSLHTYFAPDYLTLEEGLWANDASE
ncbi:hypothetical protein [Phormidium sp. CCY1219]|uniref:hypothetical protein n=1 Tax=Phormidium sp. CCY1219 TaxID=2886104 RepID=UPI002D1E9930|nr:hypothetical protein [Phormidium sp. CCY1219]MEB3828341.1 hypothetical protein [Phormidium sp. CCY1219]